MKLWRQAIVAKQIWAYHGQAAIPSLSGSGSTVLNSEKCALGFSFYGILSTNVWKYVTVKTALEPIGISRCMWESGWRERSKSKSSLERLTTNLRLFEEWGMDEQGRRMLVLKSPNATIGLVPNLQKKMNWLVEDLDLEKANALKVLVGCPSVLGYSVENNLMPFVQRLLDAGISKRQLQKMVLTYPMILSKSTKFNKTMEHFKTALGFSDAEFMKAAIILPQVVGYSMKLKVEPLMKYLEKLGISRSVVCLLLKKCPKILSFSLVDSIIPTVGRFKELGLTNESLSRLIPHAPELLTRDFDTTVLPKIEWLRDKLGIKDQDAMSILTKFPCAFKKRIDAWEGIHNSLQSLGLNPSHTAELLISTPNILGQNPVRLRDRFSYARDILMKTVPEVLACPRYLSASTERTVNVRVRILVDRGIDPTQKPLSLFCASEDRFGKAFGLR